MGTRKRRTEIEKLTKQSDRLTTFSKRKKGIFKKAELLESLTSSRVTSVVFSPSGIPYTYGNVNSVIKKHFPSCNRSEISTSVMNSHRDVSGESSGSKSSSTPKENSLRRWLEDIDVEGCQNLNQLFLLKEQLEGTREKIISSDPESFEALFM